MTSEKSTSSNEKTQKQEPSPLTQDQQLARETGMKSAADARPAAKGSGNLVLGFIFGLIFGFLLQKGGVAKYHILMGVLLLENFTVIQVMVSAIIVGMVGIFAMWSIGMVKFHLKPTRYAANIIGGLLFGVGFAMIGYCPGTGAAAFGQGNYDAFFGILGMMAGSFIYAEMSGWIDNTVSRWGDRGKLTIPDIIHLPLRASVPLVAIILIAALVVLELTF
jgi:hypothetical protein